MQDEHISLESVAEHFFNPDTAVFYSDRAEWETKGVDFIAYYDSSKRFSLSKVNDLTVVAEQTTFSLQCNDYGYDLLGIKDVNPVGEPSFSSTDRELFFSKQEFIIYMDQYLN